VLGRDVRRGAGAGKLRLHRGGEEDAAAGLPKHLLQRPTDPTEGDPQAEVELVVPSVVAGLGERTRRGGPADADHHQVQSAEALCRLAEEGVDLPVARVTKNLGARARDGI
jgi:hypothetical protein